MALIEWNESLALDIPEIDQQHRRLVAMLNDLHDAMTHEHGDAILGRILDELVDYALVHFRLEEKFFKEFGYEEAAVHAAKHREFEAKLADLQDRYRDGRAMVAVNVQFMLGNWIRDHIRGFDRKYVACFDENGLSVKV